MAKEKIDINRAIELTAKETARAVVSEMRNNNLIKREFSYYKRVELLLYNYENLKDAILQKEEDIEQIEKYGLPEKSKSITYYSSTSGNVSGEERYLQLIEKYKIDKLETERDLSRIDKALEKIRGDKYYKIIETKYLKKGKDSMRDEDIAEQLNVDRTTITRNRKRLMNKLITIFFPESVKDYA